MSNLEVTNSKKSEHITYIDFFPEYHNLRVSVIYKQ